MKKSGVPSDSAVVRHLLSFTTDADDAADDDDPVIDGVDAAIWIKKGVAERASSGQAIGCR